MRVLFLGPPDSRIRPHIEYAGDDVVHTCEKLDAAGLQRYGPDFVVCHGYRYILSPEVIGYCSPRFINLHISLLPWNRGADPNLWSHLEITPIGVSIHVVDSGIDTGPILSQRPVEIASDDTLRTSYDRLQVELVRMFQDVWPVIRAGSATCREQQGWGSCHRLRDKDPYLPLLRARGWDTPVRDLRGCALQVNETRPVPSVVLRPQAPGDNADVIRWRTRLEAQAELFGDDGPLPDEHRDWLAGLGANRKEFIIVAHPEQKGIGTIGLSRIDRRNGTAEYGILIGEPSYEGRGFARAASERILDIAFTEFGLHRVFLRVFPENKRAVRLYESLGFESEGVLRQYVLKRGVHRDVLVMGLLEATWRKRALPS